jgi:hypothetical protein
VSRLGSKMERVNSLRAPFSRFVVLPVEANER